LPFERRLKLIKQSQEYKLDITAIASHKSESGKPLRRGWGNVGVSCNVFSFVDRGNNILMEIDEIWYGSLY